jgi:AmmeMemoRadiSam system protein A
MELIWLLIGMLGGVVTGSGRAEEEAPPGIVPLTDWDKQFLLNLARQTLSLHLKDGSLPDVDKNLLNDALIQKRCCFVTLDKKDTGLRGCIGQFETDQPLYRNVIGRAVAAATQDFRFPHVRASELPDIKIEITVMTALQPLPFDSPEDLLKKLKPHVHGVLLETRRGGSTFIPQVWEQLPEKEEFLAHLCMKHGAPPDLWRTDYKHTKVQVYQAVAFTEPVFGRRVVGTKGAIVGAKGATVLGTLIPSKESPKGVQQKAPEGTRLAPGTIVTADSDIRESE